MKVLPAKVVLIFLTFISAFTCAGEEEKERKVAKVPGSIVHKKEVGKSTYVISGIVRHTPELNLAGAISAHKLLIPDCNDFQLDRKARKCTFITTRELPLEELADTIDLLASKGGEIPYWAELEARDLPSSETVDIAYKISGTTRKFPDQIAWTYLQKDQSFEAPVSVAPDFKGRVLIVPSTALCLCHSRYSIRLLDAEGKVIWRDDREAYGSLQVAIADLDQDKFDEILLSRNNHGKENDFVIDLKVE